MNPTSKLYDTAETLKPWWAAKGPRVMHYGDEDGLDDIGWVRWFSTLIGDEDYGIRIQRTVSIDGNFEPLTSTDEIALDVEDQQLTFPIDHADDVIALIRAAVAITGTPDDDGWMDETGKIWPTKDAYYQALAELQESAAQFIADTHGSEPK